MPVFSVASDLFSPRWSGQPRGPDDVNLGFIVAALLCALALPATLGAERAGENR